jgi:hypothetical protein
MWRSAWARSGHRRYGCAGGRRLAQPGEEGGTATSCLTCRARRDWLHPSPCRTQPLPAELLGSGLLPYVRSNFQSNAAFFRSNSGRNGKAGRL